MEHEGLLEIMETDGIGVATFGYIGSADREFILRILVEHCEEPVAWLTYSTPDNEEVSSLYTVGNCQKVEQVVDFFADIFHALNQRAVFSKCFSGNPDLPIVVM